jgi:glyoxylase-like metal-dependent hydrolase (beta-lactamase superfamily II)
MSKSSGQSPTGDERGQSLTPICFLNCFTCSARVPANWHTGTLCLLVETNKGLVLIDTGLGQEDYVHKPGIVRTFQAVTIVPLDPEESAVRQVVRLNRKPEDVRHIVLTHMHFDHCGGLPDFPHATVHVHCYEYEAFTGSPRRWTDLAYVRRHIAHRPEFALYDDTGESWFDWPAVRLPFEPEMWLVPLFGHTRGHCGIAIRTETGWLFHAGDAAPIDLGEYAPRWLIRTALGPCAPRLRRFRAAHPEIRVTTGHMWLDFFRVQGAR